MSVDNPLVTTGSVLTEPKGEVKLYNIFVYEFTDKRLEEFPLDTFNNGNAGVDLRACIVKPFFLHPNEVKLIDSGLKIKFPTDDYVGFLMPRSGFGHKEGIVIGNLVGVIDANYTDTIKISLWNRSEKPVQINPLDRVAQLVIVPKPAIYFEKGKVEPDSRRGDKGFGSSGKS